ncbi:MAG: DUF885 domain-containing protein [Gammaproteobacteria bacterium]|nr:DUF885 domain-containing protein [Gammaproteobacteria bacterium]
MHARHLTVLAMTAVLTACATPPAPTSTSAAARRPPAAPVEDAGKQLNAMLEQYFEEYLQQHPVMATFIGDNRYNDQLPNSIGPEYRARAHELNERYLEAVRRFDPARLSGEDRISYEIFLHEREREQQSERFPDYLLPLSQTGGLPTFMPSLGSGTNAQPFATVQDYENWLKRLDGFVVWMDQAIVNMREGVAKGVVQPRPVMEKVLPQLDSMIVARAEDSVFYKPVSRFPDSIATADRERLAAAYKAAIEGKVVPAYRRVRDYVRDEYLPKTRTSVAWTALPDGKAWYAFQVREHTTTDMTPEEIHQLGLSEVKRILGEMDRVRQQVGFEGDLHAFFKYLETDPKFYFTQGADLIQGYRDLKVRIDAALPKLFSVFPKADYEIREVEAYRAQSAAGAYYQGASADGSRPGIFYVNTYNLKAQPKFGMETLSLHEASPGHHFQGSIQQELTGLPKFRRFGGDYTAYVEGWALYSESLGKELGMFTDPYQWFGRLNDEQLRAMRLVVDTGLHALGWSREQAIQYMLDNSTLAESDVVSEVERYIAWPGQALGYKVGDLRIQGLRHKAERELGDKFDLKDFHREVLSDGAVPMQVLEAKVDRWIAARK